MRIALDAMGGDHAPRETVHGALRAIREDSDIQVVLVGHEDRLKEELDGQDHDPKRIDIVHAAEVIEFDESPVEALRRKKDNSIVKAFKLKLKGEADAVVSAGNTGAVVGAGTLLWKLIPGVRRAGIAVTLGTQKYHTLLIDVGANIHCRPLHLLHYGMMASIYAECVLGHENPRVALLNIGSEDGKGNELVKETRELFERARFNYIGHAEGNDLFRDRAEVVVCEGFVGNVVLKVSEGLSETMHTQFEEIVGGHVDSTKHPIVARRVGEFRAATDYAEVGGAVLLGVNGTCLICHGRSDRRAIGNALKLAGRFVRAGVLERIATGVDAQKSDLSTHND